MRRGLNGASRKGVSPMDTHLNPVQKTSVRFKRAICVGLASALLAMSAVPAMADGKGTVTATSLYVRKTASTEAKALCSIRKGQRVTILDTDGDWYKVKTGETIGYCAKQYIDHRGAERGGEQAGRPGVRSLLWAMRPRRAGPETRGIRYSSSRKRSPSRGSIQAASAATTEI